MSRRYLQLGYQPLTRPRDLVKVVPAIEVAYKLYTNPKQAAITIAWVIANNLNYRHGNKPRAFREGWNYVKLKAVYKRALRRVSPICKRLLNESN